jgi:hypothetical protein
MQRRARILWLTLFSGSVLAVAQPSLQAAEVTAQLDMTQLRVDGHRPDKTPSAVIWLKPLQAELTHAVAPGRFARRKQRRLP